MRTSQLEKWCSVVKLAQKVHHDNIKKQGKQVSLLDMEFTSTPTPLPAQDLGEADETPQIASSPQRQQPEVNKRKSKWVEQDLRELLLNSQPNVRYRTNEKDG